MSFNQAVIEEFRANAGRVGGPFEGAGLILLTTTGARSGREHTTPLGRPRGPGGQGMYVVGSAGGSDRHPDWYRNLLARPLVRVETGTEVYEAVAVPAEGARREELFAHIVREEPGYGEYQRKTRRVIPIVELQRTHEAEGAESAESAEDGIAGMLTRVHGWLRAQIAELLRLPAGESAPVGMQLRQHCLAFCQTLEAHHTGEDTGLFPWLAERHPQLAGFFRRLEEEHRDIERTQTRIAGLIRGGGDQAAVREELEALSRELLAHLDREEGRAPAGAAGAGGVSRAAAGAPFVVRARAPGPAGARRRPRRTARARRQAWAAPVARGWRGPRDGPLRGPGDGVGRGTGRAGGPGGGPPEGARGSGAGRCRAGPGGRKGQLRPLVRSPMRSPCGVPERLSSAFVCAPPLTLLRTGPSKPWPWARRAWFDSSPFATAVRKSCFCSLLIPPSTPSGSTQSDYWDRMQICGPMHPDRT